MIPDKHIQDCSTDNRSLSVFNLIWGYVGLESQMHNHKSNSNSEINLVGR